MRQSAEIPESETKPSHESALAPGLVQVLEDLPNTRIEEIAARLGVELDSRKRIGRPLQLARGLVVRRDLRRLNSGSPSQSEEATDLLVWVARRHGRLPRAELGQRHRVAADDLIERGLLFEAPDESGDLLLPGALALQLPRWEGEEATSVRGLLAQLPAALAADVARTFSKRPPVAPWLLALEDAYRALLQPTQVRALLAQLEPPAFELLQHVARLGGEVNTEELLDLERQPMRLHHAGSVARVRRGVGYELERRALLLPVPPNRHLIPHEVLQVLLEKQLRIAQLLRSKARERLHTAPIEPLRAQFAIAPTARALAGAALASEQADVRAGVGTARRLVKRLATRLGLAEVDAQFLACVSRKAGLWVRGSSLRSGPVHQLAEALLVAWCSGGVWDEGRVEPEVWRWSKPAPLSPANVLRQVTLEALAELAVNAWVPWSQLFTFVMADPRLMAIERQYERHLARTREELLTPESSLVRIVFQSAVLLGLLDVGDIDESDTAADSSPTTDRATGSTAGSSHEGAETLAALAHLELGAPLDAIAAAVRLSALGVKLLGVGDAARDGSGELSYDGTTLRVGASANVEVSAVLDLMEWAPFGEVAQNLELSPSMATIELALGKGAETSRLRRQLSALAPLSPLLEQMLQQAGRVEARTDFVPALGFLWIDDLELLERLRSERSLKRLFVEPSPPGGLLVAPGVELDRLALRCRSVGIEIVVDGSRHVVRKK